jgi:histidyl-tRNA synthetase
MSSKTIQSVRGMKDVLPDESPLWLSFEETVRAWLRAYGYRNIRMPILEPTELFKRSIGEATDIVEKEMFSFVDREKDSLTLRPEGTASCVRALVQHGVVMSGGPQRLYYDGPMFRHERPQKGRYRQFHQVGVEAVGFPGPDIDAEHLVMCARLWRGLGLDGVALDLNNLGDAKARERYRARLVSYLERHEQALDADSKRRLHANPLRVLDSKNPAMQPIIEGAPRLADDIDDASRKGFEELQQVLRAAGVDYRLNPRLVRGLDYYNGAVYEWAGAGSGSQNAVCAGGRYDGLVAQLGGAPVPACGFAIGVERVLELIKAGKGAPARAVDVYIVRQGQSAAAFSWQVAEQFRDAGLSVLLHCGGGNMAAQMKRADASGARFAAVIGDNEAAAGLVGLKALREDAGQTQASIPEAIFRIAKDGK